jgi:hypothetical protein
MKRVHEVTVAELCQLVQECHKVREASYVATPQHKLSLGRYTKDWHKAATEVCQSRYSDKIVSLVYICTAYGEVAEVMQSCHVEA